MPIAYDSCAFRNFKDFTMIWRPFTQEKTTPPPVKIVRGFRSYLQATDGKQYMDMIGSWWLNLHGHAEPSIAKAIADQAQALDQVIFTAFTHDPAEQLERLLKNVLPPHLDRFFLSDNGSTSIEIALKMAYQFFTNHGNHERKLYLHLEGAYHGDTYGAMSVSGQYSRYHATFSPFFFSTMALPVPEFYEEVEDIEWKEASALQWIAQILEEHGKETCALIVEPLLQGARGMVLHRPQFLEKLIKMVRAYGILVIFDEVFTGLYRTGKFFAMDHLSEKPDFLCLSKGLTGGFLPLAVTVTTDTVYEAFLSDDPRKAFIHGHSYTGNPIACAAACQSLRLLNCNSTKENIKKLEAFHRSTPLDNVQKRRTLGVMTAFDLACSQQAQAVAKNLFDGGILLRPLGSTLYLLPSYCLSIEELSNVYKTLNAALASVHKTL